MSEKAAVRETICSLLGMVICGDCGACKYENRRCGHRNCPSNR